ncbi:BadF/BadG/BcrA/BcrD ATPase family protein [Microtetraspora sp. NBRC 16547]|uniref:N-acetylglucosamine kinase n=1 Tax=Microtetraspora sp. NBRC 16547 TaxID=3030993 RepID=UPI0024A4D916|nr:BadF/BadG/BcrA/BcrD ATPase family protein [Microtetraspora sp. NBRC 16547]GLW98611.1 N-acetylglucosamine kinase [Microtetraspora sp. NBRC 16547]
MTTLVIGVDGGGTGTRCVVATRTGQVAGRGRGSGANVLSAADPVGSLRTALEDALTGIAPDRVVGGVFALAGAGSAPERAERLATEAWRACGLSGRPVVVPDILAAFAGATEEPSGTVLIAGTGAIAARIHERAIVARADGYGWILGDEGSGVWIGRRAVQALLAALDGRGAPTALLDGPPECSLRDALVDDTLIDVPGEPGARGGAVRLSPDRVVRAVQAGVTEAGPAWLGRFAPAVEAAARLGDATALAILQEAADRLVATAESLGEETGPTVLAGSLLTNPTVLAELVRSGLGRPTLAARDGAAGAAALALHHAAPDAPDAREVMAAHRRLIA